MWYRTKLIFEASVKNVKDLQDKVFDGFKISERFSDDIGETATYLIESQISSFLRPGEDYVFHICHGLELENQDRYGEYLKEYYFAVNIASTNPDTKRKIVDRVGGYLSSNNIEFKEEDL